MGAVVSIALLHVLVGLLLLPLFTLLFGLPEGPRIPIALVAAMMSPA